MAGLRVLFVTTDRQEDAFPSRCLPDSPQIARRDYGPGLITVPGRAKAKRSSCSIVKAPCGLASGLTTSPLLTRRPRSTGGRLPGVLLIAITDGTDAAGTC